MATTIVTITETTTYEYPIHVEDRDENWHAAHDALEAHRIAPNPGHTTTCVTFERL